MKVKLRIVTCSHETKYGIDTYTRVLKKDETLEEAVSEIAKECEYDPDTDYSFDSNIEELVIDTDDFEEITQKAVCQPAMR